MVDQYATSRASAVLTQLPQVQAALMSFNSDTLMSKEIPLWHNPRNTKIYKYFCRLTPRLLSSHTVYFDSNEYATALYHKLSEKVIGQFSVAAFYDKMLQEQYKFLDQRQPPSTLVNKDQALASSTAFAHFLNVLAEQEEEEGGNVDQMKHIQKEFSEMFTNWSRLSQLSVGFMMYLDSRIEADGYLMKVITDTVTFINEIAIPP